MLEVVKKIIKGKLRYSAISNPEEKNIVEWLLERGAVRIVNDEIEITDKIEFVDTFLSRGFSIEFLTGLFNWREFEDFSGEILGRHGYTLLRNYRFSHGKHRFEIDVVGFKRPMIICVDCKQYRRPRGRSINIKQRERHLRRVKAFAVHLKGQAVKIGVSGWGKAFVIPIVVTLLQEGIHLNVPVVPIFKLNMFLLELALNTSDVKRFEVEIPRYSTLT